MRLDVHSPPEVYRATFHPDILRSGNSWRSMTFLILLASIEAGMVMVEGCGRSDHTIVVGSKNFTEQVILGELLAQQIEAKTDLQVSRKLNLGGTFICHQALVAGQIDTYVEYTGTALTAILNAPPSGDPDAAYRTVQEAYRERFHLQWLPPLGFNNTFAILIRDEDASKLGVRTISQLAEHASKLQAGFGYEFLERADGLRALAHTYGLRFAEPPRVMDLALTYQALADRKVDVIAGDSTNGLITSLGLAVLRDDRHYFPSYQAAPIVSEATAARLPQVRDALSALAGTITDDDMRRLNYQVDGRRRNVKEVVGEFRNMKGL
ncbi:MAG: ABC transporter substrate-binding protein [Nitrospiraceae bacterium]|nr:ABC transporter substrate-binding protein [Nitrospiraceae bacterium]